MINDTFIKEHHARAEGLVAALTAMREFGFGRDNSELDVWDMMVESWCECAERYAMPGAFDFQNGYQYVSAYARAHFPGVMDRAERLRREQEFWETREEYFAWVRAPEYAK